MRDFISDLQNKPYATRVKILWGTTIGFALILIIAWAVSLKTTIKNTSGQPLITPPVQGDNANQTEANLLAVERTETAGNILKIYFNFNNQTDDILNVSKLEDITLITASEQQKPSKMLDRQGQTFVRKILSHTQNFGVLVFDPVAENEATLTFNKMFLEKNPDQLLKQTVDLDFSKLNQDPTVRN